MNYKCFKMKNVFIIVVLIFNGTCFSIAAQTAFPKLIPYRKGYLWGFCDTNKKIKIKPQYKNVWAFKGNVALVKYQDKLYFVNKSGKRISRYYSSPDDLNLYFTSIRFVSLIYKDKYGFVDSFTGKEITPFIYEAARDFSDGFAAVKRDGKWGYIDETGKNVISYKFIEAYSFSDGMAKVVNIIIDKSSKSAAKENIYGFINKKGKLVLPFRYRIAGKFRFGLCPVTWDYDRKKGYINKKGKLVIYCSKYDYFSEFCKYGFASVYVKEGGDKKIGIFISEKRKCGLINRSGKLILDISYDTILLSDFKDGMALVEKDMKSGFIDTTGKLVIPCEYDSVSVFSDGLSGISKDGKGGFIDFKNKLILSLPQYYACKNFSEDLAVVVKRTGKSKKFRDVVWYEEKYGYIDKTGKLVIPCKYQMAHPFRNAIARVYTDTTPRYKYGQKYGYIDKKGTEYWDD